MAISRTREDYISKLEDFLYIHTYKTQNMNVRAYVSLADRPICTLYCILACWSWGVKQDAGEI